MRGVLASEGDGAAGLADRNGVDELIDMFVAESLEALERVERCVAAQGMDEAVRAEMMRVVHTIKGAAGMFGLRGLGRMAHGGEEMLCAGLGVGSLLEELRVELCALGCGDGVRGLDFGEVLSAMLAELAGEFGRRVRLEMVGEVEGVVLSGVRDAVIHAVRNAVVHGIEAPGARVAAGKAAEGLVRLRVLRDGGWMVVEVADDGAGVDVAQVLVAAVRRGLVSAEVATGMGMQEAMELMFVGGVSTAERVTLAAGRGVGLDAVRAQVRGLGGVVEVDSVIGVGSVFRMRVPVRALEARESLEAMVCGF